MSRKDVSLRMAPALRCSQLRIPSPVLEEGPINLLTTRALSILFGWLAGALALSLAGLGWAQGLEPLAPLPPQKPEQVELGKYLFFDPRLSGDGGVSCDACHDPVSGWGDGKALSTGYPGSEYFRNAQTLLNAAYYRRNYWDGRMAGSDLPTTIRDHLTEAHFMQVDGRLFP